MKKKYEFTGETILLKDKDKSITLRQIVRLCDGLVGGWIQREENLSQSGNCFVYENAKGYR